MAEENWIKVAVTAMALGVGLYLIPLGMITWPALIRLPGDPVGAMIAFVALAVGLAALSFALIGRAAPSLRAGLLLLGFALLFGPVLI